MARPTVTTDGTGKSEAPPDLATVEITAIRSGSSATVARRSARDCAETIRESLTAEGVSGAHIRRVSSQIEEPSQMFDRGEDDDPYRATERLVVECLPETAGDVVTAVTDAGGTVPDVAFHLHEDVRRSLEEEALDAAMDRARRKAKRLAAAEGATLAGIREITTTDGGCGMESIVDEALAGRPDSCPDPITVTESVEAVYELDREE